MKENLDVYKKTRLHRTFDYVAQAAIVFIILCLVYYNGLMLVPHITPIFWAILWTIFLHKPLIYITHGLAQVDKKIAKYKLTAYGCSCVLFLLIFLLHFSLLNVIICTIVFSFWSFLLWGDRATVSVVQLLFVGLALLGLPLYLFIRSCIDESAAIVTKVQDFVQKNPQFQNLLDDFGNSPQYVWANMYAKSWGMDQPPFDPELVKAKIIEFSMQFSSQFTNALGGIVGIVADSARLIISFLTFFSTLFYFLQSSHQINKFLSDVSPFSKSDSHKIMSSLIRSVVSVFLSSFLVGQSHGFATYLCFRFADIDLALVLSFITGVMSMMPILGSFLIWIPIAIGLGVTGNFFSCILLITVQVMLQGPVDSIIYSLIPGNSFLVGISLAMGVYVFGTVGLILGPLLVAVLEALAEIYREYAMLVPKQDLLTVKLDHTQLAEYQQSNEEQERAYNEEEDNADNIDDEEHALDNIKLTDQMQPLPTPSDSIANAIVTYLISNHDEDKTDASKTPRKTKYTFTPTGTPSLAPLHIPHSRNASLDGTNSVVQRRKSESAKSQFIDKTACPTTPTRANTNTVKDK